MVNKIYVSLLAVVLFNMVGQNKVLAEDRINVIAKIGDPSVPGAVVCKDYDSVKAAMWSYRQYSERALRQSILGKKQEQLMHGSLKSPNIKIYGCILVESGTSMLWDGNWMPATVSVKLANGKLHNGVTDGSMIKQPNEKVCRDSGLDCNDYNLGKSNTCYPTQVCE